MASLPLFTYWPEDYADAFNGKRYQYELNGFSLGMTKEFSTRRSSFAIFNYKSFRLRATNGKSAIYFEDYEDDTPTSNLIDVQRMPGRIQDIDRVIMFLYKFSIEFCRNSMSVQMLSCFEIMWRSVSTPYVKLSEIEHAVTTNDVLYKGKIFREKSIPEMLIVYERYFPEMANGPVTPRKLKHLCRCGIRTALAQKLFDSIDQLKIPNSLKQYLRLEC